MEGSLVDCNDVHGLVTTLNINHNPEEWRLFIHSLKLNLKTVLLHHGKVLLSITFLYAVNEKESCDNMKLLLNCINCKKYQWQLCRDLKVVIFLGQQQGYTKFCCLLCNVTVQQRLPFKRKGTGLPDNHWNREQRT
jgi:hypothetical protein